MSVSVHNTLFPEISDLATDEKFDRIRSILGEGIVFSGVFVIPGFFGAAAIGERVLQIYRPSFGKGAGILVILVLAYVADVYASQFVSALNALDRPRISYRVNMLFISANLVLNVVLIWRFGWYGAATATFLSTTIRAILSYRSIREVIGKPDIPLLHIGWEVVAAVGMFVVVWLIKDGAPEGRIFTVLLVLFGAAVYTILLVALSSFFRRKLRRLTGSVLSPATE